MGKQRRSESLPLPLGQDGEQVQEVEGAVRVVLIEQLHDLEETRCVDAGRAFEAYAELPGLVRLNRVASGRHRERCRPALRRDVRLVAAPDVLVNSAKTGGSASWRRSASGSIHRKTGSSKNAPVRAFTTCSASREVAL